MRHILKISMFAAFLAAAPLCALAQDASNSASGDDSFAEADIFPADNETIASSNDDKCSESFTYANALMRAENAYVRRRYATVIELLRPIYEKISCLDDPNTVIEIDLLLGVTSLETGKQQLADAFFMNVLRSEPDHVVGSVITIPESSAKRIETLRAEHVEELNKIRAERSPNTVVESLYVLTETEKHRYWLNFLPFGAGAFQMHETGWGIAYASIQTASILMTIVGGGMVEYLRSKNGSFKPQNYQNAKDWQYLQIAGITVLLASYLASVIHAAVIYEDSSTTIHSPSLTMPDIAHSAAPFIMPDGAGLAYGVSF